MTSPDVPILMYHQIAPEAPAAFRKYTVSPAAFRKQMTWLGRAGYVPITMDALVDARVRRAELPQRPVIITFDDGFESCVRHAVPVLQELNFTAVFYLVAGLMGRESSWLVPERGCSFPLVDWQSARQLQEAGFQCGAHTMSHPRLTTLTSDACMAELRDARRLMEDHLGGRVRHLAYPFGDLDARVRTLAADAGYETACTVRIGLSRMDDDLLALHRVPIIHGESRMDFVCRVRTARSIGELLRQKAGRLRIGEKSRDTRS